MSVYFCNKEAIDLDAIRLMGYHDKVTENPIGFFGTGLKFAIATLLRFGQDLNLTVGGKDVAITRGVKETRSGREIGLIFLDGEQLGWTLDLGKNWDVEQAYRELHSNTVDEGGLITVHPQSDADFGTIIRVDGLLFDRAYENRKTIFLGTDPISTHPACSIHAGGSNYGFYRGIRALGLEQPSVFTYNVQDVMRLTEDRTVESTFSYKCAVSQAISQLDDEDMLKQILLAGPNTFESRLDWDFSSFSDAFMRVCSDERSNMRLNRSAFMHFTKLQESKVEYTEIDTEAFIEGEVQQALTLLRTMGVELRRDEFLLVASLGTEIYGAVREGQIFIAQKTLERGTRFLASTLYEEYLHKSFGFRDESRELQDFLLDKLLFYVHRLAVLSDGEITQDA